MTKRVMCGSVPIGGGSPISIQSMTNVPTEDVAGVMAQIRNLHSAGCEIVRLAIPNPRAAEALGPIKESLYKESINIPLVADIHFDPDLAIAAIENGADKVRINPGNIGDSEGVKAVCKAASLHKIPIRVGVNSGSLEKDILEKYGGVTAEGLAESAMRNVNLLESFDFEDIVISIKSSQVPMNVEAHRLLIGKTEHPFHIGITEAGTYEKGKIKSAAGLGALLLSGIGDTLRVSLTGDPVQEVLFAKDLLELLEFRNTGINFVSCPTCGRTKVDLLKIAEAVERGLTPLAEERRQKGLPRITVAVMGCAVNGPGEAREADLGVACGRGKGVIFAKGEILKTVEEDRIAEALIDLIKERKEI